MMESILLAKIMGVMFIVTGLGALIKKKEMREVVEDYSKDIPLMYVVGIFELILGLVVILMHSAWDSLHQFIISLVGWIMVVEGAMYVLLPHKTIERWIKKWNIDSWYITGGIVAIVIGLYLVYIGFLS